ncbi:MAG: tetratricopeptide repeat protein [Candidatus Thiodiazotropha sp.]|jgi:tetratricopeptide (TPR) repeat protein
MCLITNQTISTTTLSCLVLTLLITGCSGMGTSSGLNIGQTQSSDKADRQLDLDLHIAQQLVKKNKIDQAKTRLRELVDQNPNQAAPLINLGIIQLNENEAEAAEKLFNAALKIDSKNIPARNQLAISLRMQGRFSEAEQAYKEVIRHAPDYSFAHRNLGILYDLYLAKPDLALIQYQKYQALSGENDQEIAGWISDLQRRTQSAK